MRNVYGNRYYDVVECAVANLSTNKQINNMLSFKEFIESKIPTAIVIHDRSGINSIHESVDNNQISASEYNFTPKEKQEIYQYGRSSFPLNAYLLGKHHANQIPDEQVILKTLEGDCTSHHLPTLDSITSKIPLSRDVVVYSGLGFDPRYKSHPGNLVHFPAFTSTSTSANAALRFAVPHQSEPHEDDTDHVLCVHLKEGDPGAYIHGQTPNHFEFEYLLPRNSTMRITRSEPHPNYPNIMMHHAELVHNVNPNDIERDPIYLHALPANFHKIFNQDPGLAQTVSTAILSSLKGKKFTYDEIRTLARNLNIKDPRFSDFFPHIKKFRELHKKELIDMLNNDVFDINRIRHAENHQYLDADVETASKDLLLRKLNNDVMDELHLRNAGVNGYFYSSKPLREASKKLLLKNLNNGLVDMEHIRHAKKYGYYDDVVATAHEQAIKNANELSRLSLIKDLDNGIFNLYGLRHAEENGYLGADVINASKDLLLRKFKNNVFDTVHVQHADRIGYFDDKLKEASKNALINNGTSNADHVLHAITNKYY